MIIFNIQNKVKHDNNLKPNETNDFEYSVLLKFCHYYIQCMCLLLAKYYKAIINLKAVASESSVIEQQVGSMFVCFLFCALICRSTIFQSYHDRATTS